MQLKRLVSHHVKKGLEKTKIKSTSTPGSYIKLNSYGNYGKGLLPAWCYDELESWFNVLDFALVEIVELCTLEKTDPPPYFLPTEKSEKLDYLVNKYIQQFKIDMVNSKSFNPAGYLFECEEFPMDFFENENEMSRLILKNPVIFSDSETEDENLKSKKSETDNSPKNHHSSNLNSSNSSVLSSSSILDSAILDPAIVDPAVIDSTISDPLKEKIEIKILAMTQDQEDNIMFYFLKELCDVDLVQLYIDHSSVRELTPKKLCGCAMADLKSLLDNLGMTKEQIKALYKGLKRYAKVKGIDFRPIGSKQRSKLSESGDDVMKLNFDGLNLEGGVGGVDSEHSTGRNVEKMVGKMENIQAQNSLIQYPVVQESQRKEFSMIQNLAAHDIPFQNSPLQKLPLPNYINRQLPISSSPNVNQFPISSPIMSNQSNFKNTESYVSMQPQNSDELWRTMHLGYMAKASLIEKQEEEEKSNLFRSASADDVSKINRNGRDEGTTSLGVLDVSHVQAADISGSGYIPGYA